MKVLLTGASGLLGAHLLQEGLKQGWSIKALTRSIPSRSYLRTIQDQVEIVEGDLSSAALPAHLLQGVDVIIHAAALVSPRQEDEEAMMTVNNTASQKLWKLAQQEGTPQWVQISTTAVLTGAATPGQLCSETDFGHLRPTGYARSKYAFDQFLRVQTSGPRLLQIYPGYILGAWDSTPSSGAILLQMRYGKLKAYLEGSKNFVAAHDVAQGIIHAIEKKQEGDFILGGFNLKISEFLEKARQALALENLQLKALSAEEFAQLPAEEQNSLREFCASAAISSQKARSSFQYQAFTSIEQMLQESVDSFVKMRLLRK